MKIRTKLSLILTTSILVSSAAVSAALIMAEKAKLEQDAALKTQLIAEAASKTALESLLDPDDLMLISHLKLLLRDHPYFLAARVRSKSGAFQLGALDIPPSERPQTITRAVTLPPLAAARGVRPQGEASVGIDLVFSGRSLEEEVKAALDRSIGRVLRLTALLGLLAVGASFFIAGAVTRPITALSEAIEHIGEGNLGTQIPAGPRDELGKVAAKFNEMSAKLLELDRMKKEFVASVTHELRSPLGAMESYIRMLREKDGLNERQNMHLLRIEESASRLGQFITNLLEKAKIERGQLEFNPRETDLGEMVKETAVFFRPRFREAGLTLVTWREPGLRAAWGDPERLQQVLVNLVANAMKFTPSGGTVTVSVLRKGTEELMVQVEDTGVGIAKEDAERIFRPFERVPNRLKAQGAGLGLSIAKTIVEKQGGRIGVDSEPGRGSRFWFTVPVRVEAAVL